MKYKFRILLILIIVPMLGYSMNPNKDIIVYGNSSAAVTAAIQSARMGKNVLFISSDECIGGLTASGLGATDINNYKAIGGISREFYKRVFQYYNNPNSWTCQNREAYFTSIQKRVFTGRNMDAEMQWVFEPQVAQKIYKQMLEEERIEIVFGKIRQSNGVILKNKTIQQIVLTDGTSYKAKVFIDASYEGDLLAQAGVTNLIGREANSTYNETMNGILPNRNVKKSAVEIDPYQIEGDKNSGLLPFIECKQPGEKGENDERIQAYCYRFTLTNNKDNLIPIQKPQDYDSSWFEFMARLIQGNPAWNLTDIITITPMPNMKTDINHADFVGANYEWPKATYTRREEIKKMHRAYALGLIWFLGHDERVPDKIKMEMRQWGLPKDEFIDNGNFPYQLYVREARRMVSDYVMTEHEVTGNKVAPYSIGLGTYWFDSHIVSRFVDEEGRLRDEGGFWGNQTIYPISYLSIVPKKGECSNLITPVCLSASHAAYGSIRMEPVYMVLGQSAAIAAAMCTDQKIAVQELNYDLLQPQLVKYGQIIKYNNK